MPRPGRARLDARGARHRVDLQDAVEPPEVERHRAVVAGPADRVGAADHARATAVRGHRQVLGIRPLERGQHLRLVGRVRHDVGHVRELAAQRPHHVEVRGAVPVEGSIMIELQRRGRFDLRRAEAQMRGQRRPLPPPPGRPPGPSPSACGGALPSSFLVTFPTGILARGPWQRGQVAVQWRDDSFEPDPTQSAAADRAIAALQDRGSPAHDGLAARLCAFEAHDDALRMTLQPMRWSLRLSDDAAGSMSVLCVARDTEGRWLAGRRAPWVATWAGRWALGAGGAVEVGEDPVEALTRELEEEWGVVPERFSVEALVSPADRAGDAHRPGLARRGHRGGARRRARRARLVASRAVGLAGRR